MLSIKKWGEKMQLKIKEVDIEGIKFKIKELDTKSALELSDIGSKSEMSKKLVELSVIEPKFTDEYMAQLPARIGTKIIDVINELNGFQTADFPKVPEL